MTEPHRIHLGEAWEPPGAAGGDWIRRFGRPSGIGPTDAVWLVIERPDACAVTLNGVSLPAAAGPRFRHEITPLLARRNELVLGPGAAAGGPPEVVRRDRAPLPPHRGAVFLEIVVPTHDRA